MRQILEDILDLPGPLDANRTEVVTTIPLHQFHIGSKAEGASNATRIAPWFGLIAERQSPLTMIFHSLPSRNDGTRLRPYAAFVWVLPAGKFGAQFDAGHVGKYSR